MNTRVLLAAARTFRAMMHGQKTVKLVGYSVAESKQIAQLVARHFEEIDAFARRAQA